LGGSAVAIVTFYRGDPNVPRTTQRTHLGANAVIGCQDKILLEKRRDCDLWGLVGGGVKKRETPLQAVTREVYEELGVHVAPERFQKLHIYDEPKRIAAYQDGSVWKMVIVAYYLELDAMPQLQISKESKDLRFFTRDELRDISIVVTHSDIVDKWYTNANGKNE